MSSPLVTLDATSCQLLRARIDEALKPLAESLGLRITAGGAVYARSGANAQFKLEVAVIRADGSEMTKEAEAFVRHAPLYGLKPEHLGQKFKSGPREFTLIGLNTKARLKPFVLKGGDGKTYVAPPEMVQNGFGVPLSAQAPGSNR